MKKLSTYLFLLLFSFQASSWADDIQDFQIEGMNIGDSALNYFSEKQILDNKAPYYKNSNNKFSTSEFENFRTSYSGNLYDIVSITYISSDNKYIIKGITGILKYENNINDCYKKMDKIVAEVSGLFEDVARKSEKLVEKHWADKSGKSKTTSVDFYFDSGDWMYVSCFDWSKEIGYFDNLRLHLGEREFRDWLKTLNNK